MGYRLFDPATGLSVASVSMPEGWILREGEYVQDPKHFGWHVAPKLAETHGLDMLTLVSAEIEDETPPDRMLPSDGTMIQFNESDMAPDFSPEQGPATGDREFRLTSACQDPRRN